VTRRTLGEWVDGKLTLEIPARQFVAIDNTDQR